MSDEYRNNTSPERMQINPRAAQGAGQLSGGTALGAINNTADVIIARELDALICLASMAEETAQRRLAPVSFGCLASPEPSGDQTELPPLFNNYRNQIARVRESLKRTQELITSVQISEP